MKPQAHRIPPAQHRWYQALDCLVQTFALLALFTVALFLLAVYG